MLTLERLAALTGADEHPTRPDAPLQGECPVCGRRRYLEALPFDDGTALVRCLAGCDPREVLTALRVDERDVRLDDSLRGFEVAHYRDLGGCGDPLTAELLSVSALSSLPGPEPLIDDTIDLRTVALLAGAPGTTKSFVALDWAASIATGSPWIGRPVRRGHVLYIAGEGAFGLGQRLAAWQADRHVEIPDGDLQILPRAVSLADADAVDALAAHVERERYSLVVVDTLARASVGVDENSAQGMGEIIASVDRLRRATGDGTVLLVHHTGKDGATIRGSSALLGAVDTVYLTLHDPAGIRLSRTKRKDGPGPDSCVLTLREVAVDGGSSAVLKPLAKKDEKEITAPARERAWTAWRVTFGDLEGSRAEFVRTLTKSFDLPSSSAYRAVAELESLGALDVVSDDGAPKKYRARPALARAHGLPNVKPFDGHLDSDGGPSLEDV